MKVKEIMKKGILVILTACLTFWVLLGLSCMMTWYTPVDAVQSLNDLEDYYLWRVCANMIVFHLPLLFLCARQTIRVFLNKPQWLRISTVIPKPVTAMAALVLAGLVVWQIVEYRSMLSWIPLSEVPEHAEAMAMGYWHQAMLYGMVLFDTLCLLAKQIWAARRAKRGF